MIIAMLSFGAFLIIALLSTLFLLVMRYHVKNFDVYGDQLNARILRTYMIIYGVLTITGLVAGIISLVSLQV